MALKNWIKQSYKLYNRNIWKKINGSRILLVEYVKDFRKWYFYIFDRDYVNTLLEKSFRTKAQALKFAKEYMKEH